MMNNKISCVCLALLFLSSCLFDYSYEQQLVGGYYLNAIDSQESMQISYRYADAEVGEGIIGETVFEVGWNNEFIVVKQHPHEFGEPINNTVTNYYIIKVVHSNHYQAIKNNIIGPLKNNEFNETREKLKIPEVFEYSIQFDELDEKCHTTLTIPVSWPTKHRLTLRTAPLNSFGSLKIQQMAF